MSSRARVGGIVIFFLIATLILIGRLFQTAILNHNNYLAQAKDQQQVERDILPKRGSIFIQDTAANTLVSVAESVERYDLSATPKNVTDKEGYAHLLSQFAHVDEGNLLAIFHKCDNSKDPKCGLYMDPVMQGLTKDQVTDFANQLIAYERTKNPKQKDVSVNFDPSQGDIIPYIGGILFVREYERVYPEGGLLGQVLGYVNDKGGQYGFEGQYNNELKGYAGRIGYAVDSRGTVLQQINEVNGKDGKDYLLTIDRNIQSEVEMELAAEVQKDEAKSGSVIIMDPKTGAIIAMASSPSYDPNNFRQVAKDNPSYFDNPTISNIWEPGSIFKPLVMSAAIDQGLVTPDTAGDFPASVTVDGYTINTAFKKAFGHETMTDVLVNSDNVAMVWVGDKLGNNTMSSYLQKFGFGSQTGVDLKNEVAGKVQPVAQWSNVDRSTMTFGQGIAVTPIQMAAAYSAIANGGLMPHPHIVAANIDANGVRTDSPVLPGQQVIKPETAAEVKNMLIQVVNHSHKRAGVVGYDVAGKTGTAQVPDPTTAGYIPDAYNHSFAGMAPAADPKYVMLVKIDQPNLAKTGNFAESTAVPLFGRLSTFLLHYYQVPPTN